MAIDYITPRMKTLTLLLFICINSVANLLAQSPQYPSSFPWNGEPTGVSFSNTTIYTGDKGYNLGGNWYFSDSEEGWLTLEKPYTSTEASPYESWVLATITDTSVEFFINDIHSSVQKKYVYSGDKLSELTLNGYYEWKMGNSGHNDWVLTPPPFPINQNLNLGSSMTGQEYINSFLPNANFSYTEQNSSMDIVIEKAKELNIGLTFEDGKWVTE